MLGVLVLLPVFSVSLVLLELLFRMVPFSGADEVVCARAFCLSSIWARSAIARIVVVGSVAGRIASWWGETCYAFGSFYLIFSSLNSERDAESNVLLDPL